MAFEFLRAPDAFSQLIQFETDIITAYSGKEHRTALRPRPRQIFDMTFVLDNEDDIRSIRADLLDGLANPWKCPVWSEGVYVGTVLAAAATVIPADFSASDIAVGDEVYVQPNNESDGEFRTVTIRTQSSITVNSGVQGSPVGARVFPVVTGYLADPTGYSRPPVATASMNVRLLVDGQKRIGGQGASEVETYQALRVLDRRPIDDEISFESGTRAVDFGNSFEVRSAWGYAEANYPRRYNAEGKVERQWWKTFLGGVVGRQRQFFAPTWRSDLEVDTQPTQGDDEIIVRDVPDYISKYENSDVHHHIQLETAGGIIYREITNAVDNMDGTITITVSPTLPNDPDLSTIEVISFLELSRLGTDEIRLDHGHGRMTVNLSTRTVQEELQGIVYPSNGTELASMMGIAEGPTSMWHFTSTVGDYQDTEIANNDLEPDSVIRGVTSQALGSLAVEFPAAGSSWGGGTIIAADATPFDVNGTDSILILIVWELLADIEFNTAMFGKQDPAPSYGNRLHDGNLTSWNALDAMANNDFEFTERGYVVGEANHTIYRLDRASNEFEILDQFGSSGPQPIAVGTLSNATPFAFGGIGALTPIWRMSLAAIFEGSAAEQNVSEAIGALRQAQGF